MKRKITLGMVLSCGIIVLSSCGNAKEDRTAEFINENQNSFKQYTVDSEDKVERRGFSAIMSYDLGDMDILDEHSDLVIRGELTEESYTIPWLPIPYTFYSVQVNEVLKGEEYAQPGDIIAVGDMQGIINAKDYKEHMIEDGMGFWFDDESEVSDEELEHTYYDFTDGPVLHTGDELIFVMYKSDNFFTDEGGDFWHLCEKAHGKFYEIADNEYMRIYGSDATDNLTRSISEVEPKPMDEVFSAEELNEIF